MTISFPPSQLDKNFRTRRWSGDIPMAASGKIVNSNPNRIVLVFFAQTDSYTYSPFPDVDTGTDDFTIGVGSDPGIFLYKDWGSIVGGEWYAAASGGFPLTVGGWEIIYDPK